MATRSPPSQRWARWTQAAVIFGRGGRSGSGPEQVAIAGEVQRLGVEFQAAGNRLRILL